MAHVAIAQTAIQGVDTGIRGLNQYAQYRLNHAQLEHQQNMAQKFYTLNQAQLQQQGISVFDFLFHFTQKCLPRRNWT